MSISNSEISRLISSKKPGRWTFGNGLNLQVTSSGSGLWRLRFRFDGKENMISLGRWPLMKKADAIEKRDHYRKMLAQGVSPSDHKKHAKAERERKARNTFEAVAREWHESRVSTWADSYSGRVLSRLKRDIFKPLGKRPIDEITSPELLKALRVIEKRNAIESAHRVMRICGQVFRYAIATGRAKYDPTAGLKGALSTAKKGHMAAVTDPALLGGVLRAIDAFNGGPIVGCALRLAPLVFVRPGELRAAKWEDINIVTAEWRFHVTKTDSHHIVPLSTQAIAILKEIHPLTGHATFIFPNARTDSRCMSDAALLAGLRRMGIEKDETTIHGFRATARTLLDEELGFRADYIEHQLAHAVRDPNGRAYNRTKFLIERTKMMQVWADYLDGLRDGSNVVGIFSAKHQAIAR